MTGDEQALARLTDKEREVLRLWLRHATAKEIALDLGVSHHAVEKRLKSARQKLGVASSRDAALLLAEAEGYGQTASDPAEVASASGSTQISGVGALPRRTVWTIAGVTTMSLALIAALALATGDTQATSAPVLETRQPEVVFIDKRDGATAGADAAFDKIFARLDKDGSGYLEGEELSKSRLQLLKVAGSDTAAQPRHTELSAFDTDDDGRVSPAEYRTGMAALVNRARS